MDVYKDRGKKVSMILIRDYCGNPCYTKVGDDMPPMRQREQGEKITDMYVEASHHGEYDLFHIAIQLANGARHLHNIKHVEFFELVESK